MDTSRTTHYTLVPPKTVTPSLLRQWFAGMDLSGLPRELLGQLQTIARRIQRQRARWQKRETRAAYYAAAGLNGTRARGRVRRRRQIAARQLQVSA